MSNGRKYEKPSTYLVKVKGGLTSEWSNWFEGFSIFPQAEDETLLTGQIADQAALHGLLAKIASLGIPLLSVTRLEYFQENLEADTKMENRKMNLVNNSLAEVDLVKFENKSGLLWLRQALRKLQGKPLLQDEVLAKVVEQFKADQNLLGILLFGSVAAGTHTWKSDIDMVLAYETHEPEAGLANKFIDGIAVQYFFTTLKTLAHNAAIVPYLLHLFSEAQILFDRCSSVAPVIHQLKQYYTAHPEMAAEWAIFKQKHQVEKNGPACAQTTIIQRWDELEDKYSGGVRKRTFFI